jgi:hypothetical protein
MSKIGYTGVFLDAASKKILHDKYDDQLPDGWTWSGGHMTIDVGKKDTELPKDTGTEVTLTVTQIGKSNDAWALKVDGYRSSNAIPHITLAHRVAAKDSNKIENWEDIKQFTLTGKVGAQYHDGGLPYVGARRKRTRRAVNKLKNKLRRKISRRA